MIAWRTPILSAFVRSLHLRLDAPYPSALPRRLLWLRLRLVR